MYYKKNIFCYSLEIFFPLLVALLFNALDIEKCFAIGDQVPARGGDLGVGQHMLHSFSMR